MVNTSAKPKLAFLNKTPAVSKLFVKLMLSFWLCISLVIGLFALVPLMQQEHDRTPLSPQLENMLSRVAERISHNNEELNPRMLKRLAHWRDNENSPVKIYLTDDQGQVLNSNRLSRGFRHFQLMAEETGYPISHQFRKDLFFGPYTFELNDQQYFLYGRILDHRPRPWFLFFKEHKLLSTGLLILISGLICGLLAWYLGKPLRNLKHSANALAAGDLSNRVDTATTKRSDEMGDLAQAFNTMADSIESMVNNQQRLMGDISHELRTPLTRLQLSLALARKKGIESEELSRIGYEAEQLDDLIGELLSLSRISLNASTPLIDTELAESLSQVLDDAEFEAAQQGKQLNINIDESLHLKHYPKSLARAVENLLRNAIRYANSQVSIHTQVKQQQLEIVVTDDGPGVDEHELQAIFEPFYRPDNARDRETGGWGLGLAITQAAITAHKGQLYATNVSPNGLQVVISLPFQPIPK
ncbi:ATP-binding protein [Shewanella maritima]|uniref:ATP-binding protein n=1 Tax=Shewanella maritima TaxID=2520507 RepID=UPI003735B614